MTVTQYIGSRYVPIFANPIDWDSTREYEPLTIVSNKGNSYTSRQAVPKGIDISDEKYWALTGNYNSQVESYRQETKNYVAQVGEYKQQVTDAVNKVDADLAQQKKDVSAQLESQDAKITSQLATQDSKITSQLSAQDVKVTERLTEQNNKVTTQLAEQDSKVAAQIATIKSETDMISNLHYFFYYNSHHGDVFPINIGTLAADHGLDTKAFNNYDKVPENLLPPFVIKQKEESSSDLSFGLIYYPIISQVSYKAGGTLYVSTDPKAQVEVYFYSTFGQSLTQKNAFIQAQLKYTAKTNNWSLNFDYTEEAVGITYANRVSVYNHLSQEATNIQIFGYLYCANGIFTNTSLREDY